MFPQAASVIDWFDENSGVTKIPFLGTLGSIFNSVTGAGLTGAQVEQNQFNAEQTQLQRDWEQQVYENKFQWSVNDMQSAGLNPAMMYGGSPSSTAPASSGAASSAPSLMPQFASLLTAMAQLKNADTASLVAPSQINLNNANADTASSQKGFIDKQTEWLDPLNSAYVDQVNAVIDDLKSHKELNLSQADLNGVQQQLISYQAEYQGMQNDTYRQIQDKLVQYQDLVNRKVQSDINVNDQQLKVLEQEIGEIYSRQLLNMKQTELTEQQKYLVAMSTKEAAHRLGLIDAQKQLFQSEFQLNWETYEHMRTENERFRYEVDTIIGRKIYSKQFTKEMILDYTLGATKATNDISSAYANFRYGMNLGHLTSALDPKASSTSTGSISAGSSKLPYSAPGVTTVDLQTLSAYNL